MYIHWVLAYVYTCVTVNPVKIYNVSTTQGVLSCPFPSHATPTLGNYLSGFPYHRSVCLERSCIRSWYFHFLPNLLYFAQVLSFPQRPGLWKYKSQESPFLSFPRHPSSSAWMQMRTAGWRESTREIKISLIIIKMFLKLYNVKC